MGIIYIRIFFVEHLFFVSLILFKSADNMIGQMEFVRRAQVFSFV